MVAARLRDYIEKAGLSQPAAAAKAGNMPLPSFKDYVAGNRMPGGEALASLALLGINLNWLLSGNGGMLVLDEAHPAVGAQGAQLYQGSAAPAGSVLALTAVPYRVGLVDSLLLEQVIAIFLEYLDANKDRVRIDRGRHAAVIAVLYKIAAASGKADKAELEQVLRAAA